MRVVAGVGGLGALAQAKQRRYGEIEMAAFDQAAHLLVEEGDEQRGDVRAVDVGVGHHHDLLVAEILLAIAGAGAAAERLDQIAEQLIVGELARACAGDIEDLAPQGEHGLGRPVACLLGRAAGQSPSTMKISVPCAPLTAQSASLPGSRKRRVAVAGRSPFPCGGGDAPPSGRPPNRADGWLG